MESDRLLPAVVASLILWLILAALLFARRQHLPLDFVGRVQADAYLAMFRAMALLLIGLALLLGGFLAGQANAPGPLRWIAIALIAIGGVAFVARAALYLLRIKPELNRLREQLPPAAMAEQGSVRRDCAAGEQGDGRRVSNQ